MSACMMQLLNMHMMQPQNDSATVGEIKDDDGAMGLRLFILFYFTSLPFKGWEIPFFFTPCEVLTIEGGKGYPLY